MFLGCVGAGPWLEGCGNVCIPAEVAKLTSLIYNAIKVVVPIGLIIIGMYDMAKAVTTKSEDEVKKAQQLLVQKAVAGALVFVLFSAITWMISILDGTSGGTQGEKRVISCLNNLFDYKEGSSGSHSQPVSYTVVEGDTLKNIAKKFNVSVQAIRNANSSFASIDQNTELLAGTTITIPTSYSGGGQGYTDADSVCTTNGYDGALRIYTNTGGPTVNYYYVCYNYNKYDGKCDSVSGDNVEKYTFSNGESYCVAKAEGTNYAVVLTDTGATDTKMYASCGAMSADATECTKCCQEDYRSGYLLASDNSHYANNNFCLCTNKR